MAKDKTKKHGAGKKAKKDKKARSGSTQAAVKKVVRQASAKAKKIAANPAVAEIVAASLVAAAAAIKDPKKARGMAAAVGDELSKASKQSIDRGNRFWALALDMAQRSIDALGADKPAAKPRAAAKPKPAAKPKSPAKPKRKTAVRNKPKK